MPLPLTSAPKSLCILRLSAIGDVTHVLPALRTVQHHWPEAAITWIIGKTEFNLVRDIPGVEFIIFDKSGGILEYKKLFQKLRNRQYDVLLHMQVSLRASLASLAVRAPIRLGFHGARAKNYQWLFTNAQVAAKSRQHVLDSFLEFPRALGIDEPLIKWDLPISEEAAQFALNHIPDGKEFLVINPCSSNRIRNFRNWSVEAYAAVIEHAAERHGLETILTGGPVPEEKDYATAICAASKTRILNLVGKTTLTQLTAVLSRARVVIAPDTGPAHIANAVGTPVIGLYASSNPERTGPYLSLNITVNRYPEAVRTEFGRSPDQLPWGKRVRRPDVMELITVEMVKEQLDVVLTENTER